MAVTLNREDCLALLRRGGMGHVGFSLNALPAIVPVRYTVEGEALHISLPARLSIGAAIAHAVIALHGQGFDEDSQRHWSVMAIGQAQPLASERLDYDTPTAPEAANFRLFPEILNGNWIEFT